MPLRLDQFLNNDSAAGRIIAHAQLLSRLNARFQQVIPSNFQAYAKVVNYRQACLIIHTDSSAIATKLRQMSQRLCTELSRSGIDCQQLEIKVIPHQSDNAPVTSTLKPLSLKSATTLEATTHALPEGPLRQALQALLNRALIVKPEEKPGDNQAG